MPATLTHLQQEAIALLIELRQLETDEGGQGYADGMIARIRNGEQPTAAYIDGLRQALRSKRAVEPMTEIALTTYEIAVLEENLGDLLREEDATGLPDNDVGRALRSILAKLRAA